MSDQSERIEIGRLGVASLLVLKLLAISPLYGMAFNIKAIAQSYEMSNAVAGAIVSTELLGLAAGSLLFATVFSRFNYRAAYWASLPLLCAMQLASLLTTATEPLFIWRALSGVAMGCLLGAVTSAVGRTTKPETLFGVMSSGTHLMGAALALILPQAMGLSTKFPSLSLLSASDAVFGVYFLFAGASLFFIGSTPAPDAAPRMPRNATARANTSLRGSVTLLALSLFLFGSFALSLYLVSLGSEQAGLNAAQVGLALMVGSCLGIVTPLVAGYVSSRLGALLPAAVLLTLIGVLAGLLGTTTSPVAFLIAAPLFVSVPLAFTPIVLAALARIDGSGRLLAITPVVSLLCLSLAPMAGGAISRHGDYALNGWLAMGCSLLAIPLLAWAIGSTMKPANA